MTRKTRIPHDVERAIVVLSSEKPLFGRVRAAAELNRRCIKATPSTVRTIWGRYGLENAQKRIKAFAPAPDSQVNAISQEAPCSAFNDDYMSEAFVFSVAALAILGAEITDTSGQPPDHPFHFWETTSLPTGEDHYSFAGHANIETVHVDQFVFPTADCLI